MPSRLSVTLIGAMLLGAAAADPAPLGHPKGMPGVVHRSTVPSRALGTVEVSYDYVYGFQRAAADGAAVRLHQAQPHLAPADYHSLAELAVQSADRSQIVEIGWTVDRLLNGDDLPRLFVFHWVDGAPTCYNGCGFVQVSRRVRPGMPVAVGGTARYAIRQRDDGWSVYYRRHRVGYFPNSLWRGRYTRAGLIQAFGEVAVAGDAPCTDMGNGIFGSTRGSAAITMFRLLGATTDSALTVRQTAASYYDSGRVGRTGFRFGGPGAC